MPSITSHVNDIFRTFQEEMLEIGIKEWLREGIVAGMPDEIFDEQMKRTCECTTFTRLSGKRQAWE